MRRHSNNVGADEKAQFGKGDSIHRTTPVGIDYDTVRGIENSGIREKNVLGKGSESVRGNLIQGISDDKIKTDTGKFIVESADNYMKAHGVSTASELKPLESKSFNSGC